MFICRALEFKIVTSLSDSEKMAIQTPHYCNKVPNVKFCLIYYETEG